MRLGLREDHGVRQNQMGKGAVRREGQVEEESNEFPCGRTKGELPTGSLRGGVHGTVGCREPCLGELGRESCSSSVSGEREKALCGAIFQAYTVGEVRREGS